MVKLGTKKKTNYCSRSLGKKGKVCCRNMRKIRVGHYIIGFETDKPEDISDLEKMLNPPKPIVSKKVGTNDPLMIIRSKDV